MTARAAVWIVCVGMSLAGLGLAFPIYYGFAVAGIMAPGDGKLMMGVGALVGWVEMIEATLASLVVSIPVAFIVLAVKGRLGNFGHVVLYTYRRWALGHKEDKAVEPTYMPHAVTLAIGTAVAHTTQWFDFIT